MHKVFFPVGPALPHEPSARATPETVPSLGGLICATYLASPIWPRPQPRRRLGELRSLLGLRRGPRDNAERLIESGLTHEALRHDSGVSIHGRSCWLYLARGRAGGGAASAALRNLPSPGRGGGGVVSHGRYFLFRLLTDSTPILIDFTRRSNPNRNGALLL